VPRPAVVDAAELLRALDGVLAARRIRWYVFGAQAVVAYGVARLTVDVDAAVDLGGAQAEELADWLAPAGFNLRFPLDPRHETKLLPMFHRQSEMPLDVVITSPGLHEEFLARARRLDLGGVEVPVVSAEDLVAMKILAGRRKDLEDVGGILRRQGEALDLARVRDVVSAFQQVTGDGKLTRRLDRLLRAAR
jgi:hypothetical protein